MWFLSFRRDLLPRSDWTVTLDEHLAWVKERHEEGDVIISGPTPDRSISIALIRAHSLSEAEAIANGDPIAAQGFAHAEVLEWEVHQILGSGAFTAASERVLTCEKVAYPDGSASAHAAADDREF